MKIIKMSVDTFWKGEVRVQGQIEDETKVYQTRIFIKGSQIYDYSCSCAEGNSFRGPCVHAKALQEAFARQQKAEHTLPVSTSPEIRMMIREYTNREVARILGEEEREPVYLHPYLDPARRSAFGGTDRTGKTVYCEKPAGICTGGSQRKTGGIRKRHGV